MAGGLELQLEVPMGAGGDEATLDVGHQEPTTARSCVKVVCGPQHALGAAVQSGIWAHCSLGTLNSRGIGSTLVGRIRALHWDVGTPESTKDFFKCQELLEFKRIKEPFIKRY